VEPLTAIVYVLTSECAWRDLPPSFGVPFQNESFALSEVLELHLPGFRGLSAVGEVALRDIVEAGG
jgi:transposase